MNFVEGELVLVPYPFSDFSQMKVRPALVFSSKKFNLENRDCVIIPLTSVIRKGKYDFLINQDDLEKGMLVKSSCIKLNKILTINKSKIIMKIGALDKRIFKKVKKEFHELV